MGGVKGVIGSLGKIGDSGAAGGEVFEGVVDSIGLARSSLEGR
jgi:hypothetical protein